MAGGVQGMVEASRAARCGREGHTPCGAPGCLDDAAGRCTHCKRPLCHWHFFSPVSEHKCAPVPAEVEAEEARYKAGDGLTIGRTEYRVIYAVLATREGESQVLVVECLRGVSLYYRVIVGGDGGLSAPVVIYD